MERHPTRTIIASEEHVKHLDTLIDKIPVLLAHRVLSSLTTTAALDLSDLLSH